MKQRSCNRQDLLPSVMAFVSNFHETKQKPVVNQAPVNTILVITINSVINEARHIFIETNFIKGVGFPPIPGVMP